MQKNPIKMPGSIMSKNDLLIHLARMRAQYDEWKKRHPHQQSEQMINAFLLLKSKFKELDIPFPSKNLHLDNDAATFQNMISTPPASTTFGEPFAPVRGSGNVEGSPITLKDFEPYFKDFIIASPVTWAVGGICERGSTRGDFDILHMLPSSEEISRIIDFRIFRMLPSRLADRLHSLWEDRGAHSPFTTSFPLYRLRFERIPDAELMPMAENGILHRSLSPQQSGEVSTSSALPDTFSDIKLRTLHSKHQLETAEKALKNDKITPGEFWLMSKPVRAYYPGKHQSLTLFLDIYDKFYSYPSLSSKKFDGEHLSIHKIGDQVVIFSEDGSLLKKLNNLRSRIRSLPPHTLVIECELENWNYETGQHYPRETVNTNSDNDHYTANVFDCLYFKGKIPASLYEEIIFFQTHGKREWKAKYLSDWHQRVTSEEDYTEIDMDVHKLPCAVRYKFLELLGIKQETILAPSGKDRLNVVTHLADYNRRGLLARTYGLRELPGSEGNVVSDASRSYRLTSGKRPYQMLKFHNSSLFTAIVLSTKETKAGKGTVNVEWGLLPGSIPCKKSILRQLNSLTVASGGKSFSVKGDSVGPPGSSITIETETFNLIFDKKTGTFDFSAWAPRCLGKTVNEPDTIHSVETRAFNDFCFQLKVIDVNGRVDYLPGKSGEEFPSK